MSDEADACAILNTCETCINVQTRAIDQKYLCCCCCIKDIISSTKKEQIIIDLRTTCITTNQQLCVEINNL